MEAGHASLARVAIPAERESVLSEASSDETLLAIDRRGGGFLEIRILDLVGKYISGLCFWLERRLVSALYAACGSQTYDSLRAYTP